MAQSNDASSFEIIRKIWVRSAMPCSRSSVLPAKMIWTRPISLHQPCPLHAPKNHLCEKQEAARTAAQRIAIRPSQGLGGKTVGQIPRDYLTRTGRLRCATDW